MIIWMNDNMSILLSFNPMEYASSALLLAKNKEEKYA
jgi:hypothetical protein